MDRIFLFLVSGLTIIIIVGEFFGALQMEYFVGRVPEMTLMLLCALAIFVGYDIFKKLDELTEKINKYDKKLQNIAKQTLPLMIKELEPELRDLFGEVTGEWASRLHNAVTDKKIEIHPKREFPKFYKDTLKKFPESIFLATSLPTSDYFWKEKKMMNELKDFTDGDGENIRIFFLDKVHPLEDPDVRKILDAQHNAGVKVCVLDAPDIDRKMFVVAGDEDTTFAWQVGFSDTGIINDATAWARRDKIKKFRSKFQEYITDENIRVYEGNGKVSEFKDKWYKDFEIPDKLDPIFYGPKGP